MRQLLNTFTILYTEDEQEVQRNIAEYLQSYFKEVYVASDGNEAMQLYKEHSPDVMLLDINIPYKDGLSVAKEIRSIDKEVRILMLTAHTDEKLLLDAIGINLTKYLVKPINPSDFKKALNCVAEELLSHASVSVKFAKDFVWYKEVRKLFYQDKEVELKLKEANLLELLLLRRGHCVSNEEIIAIVWSEYYEEEISQNSIKSLVNNLRKKLPDEAIENIYAKGYCLK